jgi:hypothetical protein
MKFSLFQNQSWCLHWLCSRRYYDMTVNPSSINAGYIIPGTYRNQTSWDTIQFTQHLLYLYRSPSKCVLRRSIDHDKYGKCPSPRKFHKIKNVYIFYFKFKSSHLSYSTKLRREFYALFHRVRFDKLFEGSQSIPVSCKLELKTYCFGGGTDRFIRAHTYRATLKPHNLGRTSVPRRSQRHIRRRVHWGWYCSRS